MPAKGLFCKRIVYILARRLLFTIIMFQEVLVQDAVLQEISFPGKNNNSHSGGHSTHCPNCSQPKTGRFCSACGAEGIDHHELSVKHFLHHSLHEFTHVEDSKILNTLKFLLFYPGKLTTEYFAGRKIRYISPLRVFLIIFAGSIFFYSAFKSNVLYDAEFFAKQDATGKFSELLDKRAAKKGLERTAFVEKVNQKWQKYMSLSQLGYVLAFSLMLKAMYRKRYLVEHIVFSCHFISYSLLFAILMWPVYYYIGITQSTASMVVGLLTYLISTFYLTVALNRMYGQTRGKALVKAILLYTFYLFVINMVFQFGTLTMAIVNV